MADQTGRSLRLSAEELEKANIALSKFGSKADLAAALQMSRTTINNFFKGEPVQRKQFHIICKKLKLDWQPEAPKQVQLNQPDIDALVQATREAIRPIIKERCGTMRVLDMEQPIELTGDRGIYTNVNILERLTGRRRLEIAELLENCGEEEFDRFGLSRITEQRVPGLEAVERYNKLMVLGKPGAGKTTFLKYLAMQCLEGNFLPDHVPIFITLKDFAETEGYPGLLEYIDRLIPPTPLKKGGFEDSVPPFLRGARGDQQPLQPIISAGKALILLDGLDEVREEDTKRILRQIRDISDQFATNQFVVTCRIAAKEYTFERFTEVEVADFDQKQIAEFANNWFRAKNDPVKAERFVQKLQDNKPIQELASNPLLLTLLCLMFGESGDFPANRAELYKEGLDVLLKKWDGKRNIERDQIYKNLSSKRKEDLLSQIALTTFEQKDYFFKQKTVETYIANFINNLPGATDNPQTLQLDSEAILKSIEAQHGLLVERAKGIYSFSHLTFQEYFTAREIESTAAYERLVIHITEKRWREVFLLTTGMMRNADQLVRLMKQTTDQLLANDEKTQQFLGWVQQKSSLVVVLYKPAAVRAYNFSLALALALDFKFALTLALALDFDIAIALDLDFDFDFDFDLDIDFTFAFALAYDLERAIACAYICTRTPELRRQLKEMRDQLPKTSWENRKDFWQWWQANSQAWTVQLKSLMIEHRNIGHDWQFSDEQTQLLKQYYDANKLLVDCLNSDCYVSREVRQEIEDTLLLPIEEIERRQQAKGER